jgi:GNAT superfamily N-acetyltransferase
MNVRVARSGEAAALSELAIRSKAVWGYDEAFLERCRVELTIRPEQIGPWRAHVAEEGDAILGFFTVRGEPPEGELDSLYVAPEAIGRGVGRALLDEARRVARREGFRALQIHADPNAEAFYVKHGAVRVGEVASGSIAGRALPLLRLALAADGPAAAP